MWHCAQLTFKGAAAVLLDAAHRTTAASVQALVTTTSAHMMFLKRFSGTMCWSKTMKDVAAKPSTRKVIAKPASSAFSPVRHQHLESA